MEDNRLAVFAQKAADEVIHKADGICACNSKDAIARALVTACTFLHAIDDICGEDSKGSHLARIAIDIVETSLEQDSGYRLDRFLLEAMPAGYA